MRMKPMWIVVAAVQRSVGLTSTAVPLLIVQIPPPVPMAFARHQAQVVVVEAPERPLQSPSLSSSSSGAVRAAVIKNFVPERTQTKYYLLPPSH